MKLGDGFEKGMDLERGWIWNWVMDLELGDESGYGERDLELGAEILIWGLKFRIFTEILFYWGIEF